MSLAALAQRRQMDAMHVQAIEQIAPEVALVHGGLDVEVGCRQKPDVDTAGFVLADAPHLAGLQGAQQLGLQRPGHRPDLVEKERAAARVLDEAGPRRGRAGEGAAGMSEQLVFQQRFGQRGAVEGDEWLRGPRTRRCGSRGPPALCRCRSRP